MFKIDLKKFKHSVFASLLLILTIFVYGPSQMYLENSSEFPVSFFDVYFGIAIFSVILLFLLTFVLYLIPKKFFKYSISFVFVLSVLFWLQANFRFFDYGVLDGNLIDWSGYNVVAFYDYLFWGFGIFVSILFGKYIFLFFKKVVVFLILIQCVSILLLIFSLNKTIITPVVDQSLSSMSTFSSEKNIIILVLDTYETDVFAEMLHTDKDLKSDLDGFVYYPNSLGGFPTTYASIPFLLTGEQYDNSEKVSPFISSVMINNSLPVLLGDSDYNIDMISNIPGLLNCGGYDTDSCISLSSLNVASKYYWSAYLFDLTLFRYFPNGLKKYVLNDYSWFSLNIFNSIDSVFENNVNDLYFLDYLINNSKVNTNVPVFKFIHLVTPHPPYRLSAECDRNILKDFRDQYSCANNIVKDFVLFLKDLGIYDNSMIFVVGDHGANAVNNTKLYDEVNHDVFDFEINDDVDDVNVESVVVGSAIPLFMVKPFDSSGDLSISFAPVSLMDIPKTVNDTLLLGGNFPGLNVFDIDETLERERRFLYYTWTNDSWQKDYLPTMYEYVVNGFSWDKHSWEFTNNVYYGNSISE